MTQATVPTYVYTVYTATGCTVTAPGFPAFSVTCSPGMANSFTAPGDTVEISDPAATLVAVRTFNGALAALGLLGGGNTLPAGYTRLEYLESTGTQYIDTGCTANQDTTIKTRWQFIEEPGYAGVIFSQLGDPPRFAAIYRDNLNRSRFDYGTRMNYAPGIIYNIGQVYDIEKRGRYNYVDGVLVCTNQTTEPFESSRIGISAAGASLSSKFRLYSFVIENGGIKTLDLIPALDPTGAPCMFDLVTRTPFYNAGTGDFVTPQAAARTYSLRGRRVLPDWGKLTPTGLRRLYHVPDGYQGDALQYAAEHGFGPIQEEEQPAEGYWSPRWEEIGGVIYLRWVETAPPEDLATGKE